MKCYSVAYAKANLSVLVNQVQGESIIITRRGKPVAKLVGIDVRPWAAPWGQSPALTVVLNEAPTTPTFPDGFPEDPEDPL